MNSVGVLAVTLRLTKQSWLAMWLVVLEGLVVILSFLTLAGLLRLMLCGFTTPPYELVTEAIIATATTVGPGTQNAQSIFRQRVREFRGTVRWPFPRTSYQPNDCGD